MFVRGDLSVTHVEKRTHIREEHASVPDTSYDHRVEFQLFNEVLNTYLLRDWTLQISTLKV